MTDPDTQQTDLPLALQQAQGAARIPRAIPLNAVDGVFQVAEGAIDVFAVDPATRIYGPLRHLMRLSEGDLFAGFADVGMTGPVPDIIVIPTPESSISTAEEPLQDERIDRWVSRLLSCCPSALPPRGVVALRPGQHIEIIQGTAVCSDGTLLWLETDNVLNAGDARNVGPGFIPLTDAFWVQAISPAVLQVHDRTTLAEAGLLQQGRTQALRLALEGIATTLRIEQHDFQDRVSRRNLAADVRLRTATRDLAALLDGKEKSPAGALEPDELFRCAARVAAADGISLKATRSGAPAGRSEAVAALARFNHIRVRRARLPAEWWRGDHGAFLGFTEAEEPVCLIPARNGYRHIDADGRERKVNRQLAATLQPEAYVFYRPLPDGAVTPRALLGFVFRNNVQAFATILIASGCAALLALLTPLVSAHIFDTIIPKAEYSQLLQVTIVLITAAFASLGFGTARALTQLRMSGRIDAVMQNAVWDRLLRLPASFFQQYEVGDLANRASGINALSQALSGSTLSVLISGLFSTISLAMMIYYQPALAGIAVCFVVLVILISCVFAYLQLLYQREQYELSGKLSARTFQFIAGIATLKVGGAERLAFSDWIERFAHNMHFQLRSSVLSYSEGLLTSSVLIIFQIVSLAFFAFYVEDVSTGTFIAFGAAFGQFYGGLTGFAGALVTLSSLKPLYERTEPIRSAAPEVSPLKTDPGMLSGRIAVTHATFAYDGSDRPVLDDVSIDIHPGEFVAIVGASGSGKSTLIRLLLGFATPQKGNVTYDGHDLERLDPTTLRRQIGVVLQDGKLLGGSIRDNITVNGVFTEDQILQAIVDSGLEPDIRAMPMGIQTLVGEGGSTLSGGQKQRLLIARALVRKPRIVLFDEATSALDNVTQSQVSAALDRLRATRIIVAHRLSTIRNANRIFVFDNGRIVESGTFDVLIKNDAVFTALAKRQLQ